MQKNPSHTVPTLCDEGQYIWEGAAICTYLIGKYGPPDCSLYPKDLLTRARIDQRLYYNAAILFPCLKAGSIAVFYKNVTEVPDSLITDAHAAIDQLEKYLESGDFLVGNSLTLADLAVSTTITNLRVWAPFADTKYPRIEKWLKRVEHKFPAYTELNTAFIAPFAKFFNARLAYNKRNQTL